MEQIIRIGMDTSKHAFQLHGVNAAEVPVLRMQLRRKEMVAFFEMLAPTVDPRRRPDRRGAAENEDPGSRAIPIRAAVCGLDLTDAKGSFIRPRKNKARAITRSGDEGSRGVLVSGAIAVIQHAQRSGKASA